MTKRLTLIFLLSTGRVFGQGDLDSFATVVLDAIKTQDFEKVKALFPTEKQWYTFAEQAKRELPDNFSQAFLEEKKQEFDKIFRLTEKYEIKWKKYKVDSLNFERIKFDDTTLVFVTGHIYLKSKDRKATLYSVSAMKSENIYRLTGIRELIAVPRPKRKIRS